MTPGGEDIVIQHSLSINGAYQLAKAYFSKIWPKCVFLKGENSELFAHEDETVKKRIDEKGVEDEHGFGHIISLEGELTVVVESGDFAEKCKRDLVKILNANLGF
jgi:hypothetical protein